MASTRRPRYLDDIRQDVRQASRMLRANPAFAAIAILTLAIGIGATTAIFSVINATLLRPLPFRDPARLMAPFLRMPVQYGTGVIDMSWSHPKYETFRLAQRAFEDMAPHLAQGLTADAPDGAERVSAELVGAHYFGILGARAQLGRLFLDEEDRPTGGDRSVILSDGYWRRRFGAEPGVIGRTMRISGAPYTIVGIAQPGFNGMSGNAELWTLFSATRDIGTLRSPTTHQFEVVARLRPGVTAGAASASMPAIGQTVDRAYPRTEDGPWSAAAYTLDQLRVDPGVGRSVVLLGGAVALLLLIACVNIANLLLARGAARRRELAVRLAIGADAGRLVRQLLTESVVLTSLGAVAGLGVAVLGVRALAAMAPLAAANLSSVRGNLTAITLGGIELDGGAVAFAVGIALLTGIGVGLVPALSAIRIPLTHAMRQGATATPAFSGLRRLTGRGVLVMTEIALAVVLLVVSGLMIKSLSRLFEAQVGYDPERMLSVRVGLSADRFSRDSAGALWTDIMQRVAALPGVTSVGVGTCAPVGDHCDGTGIQVTGHAEEAHVSFHAVTPDYFKTLRIPLIRGRAFTDQDRRGSAPVMIINETAARTIWGKADPLTTPVVNRPGTVQVVGIVGDVRYEDVEAPPKAAMFVPAGQSAYSRSMLFVRTAVEPTSLAQAVRREVQAADRGHTASDIKTMRERLFDSTARSRFSTQVLGVFAAVALILASIGVYGVLSLAVVQRRRELGIRLALGAEPGTVLAMVLGQAMSLALTGAVVGALGAMVAARALGTLLYDVRPADPVTYITCIAVLGVATLAAALVPALRATRVSPMIALRNE